MEKQIYLGLGANLGDRESNLVEAINRLKPHVKVQKVSHTYETKPVGFADQPNYLNIAVSAKTNLEPHELCNYVKRIERQMGRTKSELRNGPRPIDLDILIYDDQIHTTPELTIPHVELAKRAFVLTPLADIAPDLIPAGMDKTVSELLKTVDKDGVVRLTHGLLAGFNRDIQNESPRIAIGLDKVGISSLQRIICLTDSETPRQLPAELNISIDLDRDQNGAHMSRFGTVVEDVVNEVSQWNAPNIETMAGNIVSEILKVQGAKRAEIEIRTKFPLTRRTPVSGILSQEVYELIGIAAASANGLVKLVGVEAEGMTACPCAQNLVRDRSMIRLQEEGFSDDEIDKILQAVPLPTHNQVGRGKLLIQANPAVKIEDLIHIVEASMSAETYEILKRPDEYFVVNRAHRNPKFVEDVVRDILAYISDFYPELPADSFVLARQTNMETIHKHNVYAERCARIGDIRACLNGKPIKAPSITLNQWIDQKLGSMTL